jgi:hypothetical protein
MSVVQSARCLLIWEATKLASNNNDSSSAVAYVSRLASPNKFLLFDATIHSTWSRMEDIWTFGDLEIWRFGLVDISTFGD